MIRQYFSEKERDTTNYNFCFIRITEDKEKDNQLIEYLQKNILKAYRDPEFCRCIKQSLDRRGLENYIKNCVIPSDNNEFDVAVRHGDFGEVFASLIIEFMERRVPFRKLRWKINKNKSVFGTDIVSFDSIDNPSEITYCEVKTRKDVFCKEKGKLIAVVACDALVYDRENNNKAVLDYMVRKYFDSKDFDRANIFLNLVADIRPITSKYEIFLITDSLIRVEKLGESLRALNELEQEIKPLSVFFVFVDNLSDLMKDTWDTIVENGALFIERDSL